MSIPTLFVTGFLGSGKTTLLRRIARDHPGKRLVFLVNEFAAVDVDGDSLTADKVPTHSVVGGSLFCECKAGDFLSTLEKAILPSHRVQPIEALIIETSGIANPGSLGSLMKSTGYADQFPVRGILSVVAPKSFLKLVGNLPNIEAQIRASDLVVINKTDTADPPTLDRVEAEVTRLNPEARRVRCQFGEFPFPFFTPDSASIPGEEPLETCEANPYSTAVVAFSSPVDHESLIALLGEFPGTILRLKGTVSTSEGSFRVDRSVDGPLVVDPVQSPPSHSLVLITHDGDEPELETCVAQLHQLVHSHA